MSTYKILFTPIEPYFFGNEKTFRFLSDKTKEPIELGQYDNPYYIKSERTPLQTTVFGAIRYLLLKDKTCDFSGYPDKYEDIIGKDSWHIKQESQTFGIIKNISPIFLQNGNDIYLPTPFDHNVKAETDTYTPFILIDIPNDRRQYSEEYDSKEFLEDGYMNIQDGKIIKSDKIFDKTVRVGIDTKKTDSAFYKKEYCYLNEGWSFGIYLDIDDDYCKNNTSIIEDKTVCLGQNKAMFLVNFKEETNDLKSLVENQISENTIYCMSDIYASSTIYKHSSFAITQTRDYRSYKTEVIGANKRPIIRKGETLYRLIKAGSILCFRHDDATELVNLLKNEHCQTIGMNNIIIGKKKLN